MKKIVVISDTHGNISLIEKLLPIINESDYLIHLGDGIKDLVPFMRDIKAETIWVYGNCDGGGEDKIIEIDGLKILLTHGDRHGVKNSLYALHARAKEEQVSVVFYGHTHVYSIIEEEGVTLINPGSLNDFLERSYCYAVIYGGKITAKIVPIR